MNGKSMVAVLAAVLVVAFGGLFVSTASAAGGPIGGTDGTALGGSIAGQDGLYLYSNGSVYGDTVTGNFSLTLDASKHSLSGANWNFYTNYQDSSWWTATCYMYGYRNVSEPYSQQYWAQQVSPESGPSINVSLGFNSYQTPSDMDLLNLQVQILQIQLFLQTAPSDQQDQLNVQLSALTAQLGYLEQQPRKDVLDVYGNINIQPSALDSSRFSYTPYEQQVSGWSDEDQTWVVTGTIPAWRAEFDLYGHFLADTLEQAQAMGAPYAQPTPEPATLSLLGCGLLGLLRHRRRK